jgi:hypothetical protein
LNVQVNPNINAFSNEINNQNLPNPMINPANVNQDLQLMSDDWGIYYIDQISQQKVYTRFYKGKSNNLQNQALFVASQEN